MRDQQQRGEKPNGEKENGWKGLEDGRREKKNRGGGTHVNLDQH